MSRLVRGATSTALTWNRWYSARLPDDVAAARRAELVSDLYEHVAADADEGVDPEDTAVAILWRVAAGAPADLAWRWSVPRATSPGIRHPFVRRIPPMLSTLFRVGGLAVIVLAAAFLTFQGTVALFDADGESWRLWYGVINLTAGVLVLAGLVVQRRHLALGITMVAVGMLGTSVAMYWMLPITVPISAIGVVALVLEARHVRARAATA